MNFLVKQRFVTKLAIVACLCFSCTAQAQTGTTTDGKPGNEQVTAGASAGKTSDRSCCPSEIKSLQDRLDNGITMNLYGDGVNTSEATLELSCGGNTSDCTLETVCASTMTKKPWPDKQTADKEHVVYHLAKTDANLLNIIQAARDNFAQGKYASLAVAPERQVPIIMQFAVWIYKSKTSSNPADKVTTKSVANNICLQSGISQSSMNSSETKTLNHNVMAMLMAADETEKHSHEVVYTPPPETPYLPPTNPPTAVLPSEPVCIPEGTLFVPNDDRYQSCMVIGCTIGKYPECTEKAMTSPGTGGSGTTTPDTAQPNTVTPQPTN